MLAGFQSSQGTRPEVLSDRTISTTRKYYLARQSESLIHVEKNEFFGGSVGEGGRNHLREYAEGAKSTLYFSKTVVHVYERGGKYRSQAQQASIPEDRAATAALPDRDSC